MAGTESQLVIRHLAVHGVVPAEAVSSAVDLKRIANDKLGEALSEVLAPLNVRSDQVVFIRRLKVDLDLDDQLSPGDIVLAWANRIRKEFIAAISRNTANIVVFPNAATYLARFLVDCAQGQARGVWYYRQFDGLWPLSASAAIRTAVLSDVSLACEAIRCFLDDQVVQICDALADDDAERVLAGLGIAAEMTSPGQSEMKRHLARVSSKSALVRTMSGGLKQKVLALALMTRAAGEATEANDACAYYHGMVEQLLSECGSERQFVYQSIVSGNGSLLSERVNADVQTDLASLFNLEPGVRKLLADDVVSADAATVESTRGVRFSQFGNALLLWPQIAASSWYRQFEGWQAPGDRTASKILALVTLCACQGRGRFRAAWNDGLLRDLCGVDPSRSLGDTLEWLNSQVNVASIDDLGRIYRAEFDSEKAADVRRSVSCEFGEFQIAVTGPKGVWAVLQKQPDAYKPAGHGTNDAGGNTEQADTDTADLEFLWLTDRHADTQTRIFIALLAQHTLRSFAYRLAGFSGSSMPYVSTNLLPMAVNYVSDDSSAVAYLSRVPLSVALNMAGINRGEVCLPHLASRPIRLAEIG